jgi:hypothetical protein
MQTSIVVFLASFVSSAVIGDWQTCIPSQDSCASSGFTCCVAHADKASGKNTCRPNNSNECALRDAPVALFCNSDNIAFGRYVDLYRVVNDVWDRCGESGCSEYRRYCKWYKTTNLPVNFGVLEKVELRLQSSYFGWDAKSILLDKFYNSIHTCITTDYSNSLMFPQKLQSFDVVDVRGRITGTAKYWDSAKPWADESNCDVWV